MEGFDKKLPNFGHRFESAAPQAIGIHRHPAPADDAQPLGVRRDFNGRAGFLNHGRRKKGEADREHFGQLNSLLLSAGTEEGLWERSEQTGAIAAGSIRVDTSAVGEAL
jgi:hypothetical protein